MDQYQAMAEHHQATLEGIEIEHVSFTAPRENHLPEQVYAEFWRRFIREGTTGEDSVIGKRNPLERILADLPGGVTQRRATVAATVVCWLGTNVGAAFISNAKELAKEAEGINLPDAFLMSWAMKNRRRAHHNHGYRTLEHLFMPPNTPSLRGWSAELSVDDYEVAELIAEWAGTSEGQLFISRCEGEIEYRRGDLYKFKMATNATIADSRRT